LGVGHLFVQSTALYVQRLERVVITSEGALGASLDGADPLPCKRGIDVHQHAHVPAQRRTYALGKDAAAAQRDHVAGARGTQHPADELLLGGTERVLPVDLELAGHRVTEALREYGVAVEWGDSPPRGQPDGERRLARPHESDQDERQPIRSS
jgi:hypothetical protein